VSVGFFLSQELLYLKFLHSIDAAHTGAALLRPYKTKWRRAGEPAVKARVDKASPLAAW
jgi:hypothetical protein